MERVLGLMEERGFVIRHHNLFDGTTCFAGQKGVVSRKKEYFTLGDTYTLSGAKKAVANLRRLHDDEFQYSIEMLEECYLWTDKEKTDDNRKRICDSDCRSVPEIPSGCITAQKHPFRFCPGDGRQVNKPLLEHTYVLVIARFCQKGKGKGKV